MALALAGTLSGVPAAGGSTSDPRQLYADVPLGATLGGETSRPAQTRMAFSLPAANLPRDKTRIFFFGNRLFNTNWTIAPASVDAFDGLGPLFNRVSCSGCHLRDGRGRPPESAEEPMESILVRLSLPGTDATGGPRPHPVYGDQLSDRAIPGVAPEGRAAMIWEEIPGTYGDGEPYSLRRPRLEFTDLAYGPLGDEILSSPRVAPAVIGLGLLEAVPEAEILAMADPDDVDGDGISGRPNWVWDKASASEALGRFGWKANQPSLRQQNAGAALGDIGLTSPLHTGENCSDAQGDCAAALNGGTPEMSEVFLDKLTLYTRSLAVPERRDNDDPQIVHGESLFRGAGCSSCHVMTLVTGEQPDLPEVAHQTIHPFTDLLLHDMGEGLADGRPDYLASGSEWRTPPLWGVSLIEQVNKHNLLLHDGRARGFAEAILWHGGEAEAAREAFRSMSKEDREALIAFLGSL
jgi:CxxC motif-containing protein (DUF1111 family)